MLDNVVRNTVALSIPTSGNLSGNYTIEFDCFGDVHPSAFLELDEPLARLLSPNVAFLALFPLEACRVLGGYLNGLEIMVQLDLLMENLLLGVVAEEQIRLCGMS